MKFKKFSNVNEAKLIQVIAIESVAGNGGTDDPYHIVREYFSVDGKLLARTGSGDDLSNGKFETESEEKP